MHLLKICQHGDVSLVQSFIYIYQNNLLPTVNLEVGIQNFVVFMYRLTWAVLHQVMTMVVFPFLSK